MSLYVVCLTVTDEFVSEGERIIGPYRSEEAAQKVADLIRGRAYTRLIKKRHLIGLDGQHPDVRIEADVRRLHNEAAKYHYDWAEEIVLDLTAGR